MLCGDDEPRKREDFGSHGRLGQRHMADRCTESKAVHISQSATGTQELMGWRLGGSWAARSRIPPHSLQIAAPPISGLLQVSASFLRRCVPGLLGADITRPAGPACTLCTLSLQATHCVRYLLYC